MLYDDYYGAYYPLLKQTEMTLMEMFTLYSAVKKEKEGVKPIVYSCSRIKSPDSMTYKLKKQGFELTVENAMNKMYDAVGVRAVCAFSEDVYRLVRWLHAQSVFEIVCEKDYYLHPKPNGYRSYHLQVIMTANDLSGIHAEIQIRTIATDFWATLEHQLKYKEDIPNEKLIRNELKRCADEIASTDLSMQTIRDIIRESMTERRKT